MICRSGRETAGEGGDNVWLDHRNDPINPTRGYYLQFNQDFAGVGGAVKYIRTEGETGWYHGFTKSLILSAIGSVDISASSRRA